MSYIDQKPEFSHEETVAIPIESSYAEERHISQHPKPHPLTGSAALAKLNPAPLGFGAFALCSFVLGLYNTGLITNLPQVAIGVAFGYGAMGQFICGICELIIGNMFAATSMLTFSGFFLTFGIMMLPGSGFLSAAITSGGEAAVGQCIGLVEIGYAIAAFLFLLGALRQPVLIRFVLLQVFLAFLFGGIGGLAGSHKMNIASGWVSFTLALTAWYVMCALLFTPENTMIKLPFF
ncbi:GPR1/FUN34/yaaH family-domain-containing protein [Sporodiniella umbellata]|nr:GPR1/FUN34/yaaH family-domain-containing protein [Sporodiniella umbellata]